MTKGEGERKRLWEIWIGETLLRRLRAVVHHTKALPGEAHSEGEFVRRAILAAIEATERRLNGGEQWPDAPPPRPGRPSTGKMAARAAAKAARAAKKKAPPPKGTP